MATTFGPERAMDAVPLSITTSEQSPSEFVPRTLSTDERAPINAGPDAPQPPHRAAAPSPLPPFVFPAQQASSSAPSSFSRASGRRPKSVVETHGGLPFTDDKLDIDVGGARSAPLPSFSFNPGASAGADKADEFLNPPISPQSPQHSSSPPKAGGHGHRRGGSEFVGGNLRSGESIAIMNTSPTKADNETASPPAFQPPQIGAPPPGGRRHKHRRSAAISSHDLTLILQPPKSANVVRGSSAPTSPATDVEGHALEETSKTPPEPPLPLTPTAQSAEAAKSDHTTSPEKSPARPRNAPRGAGPVPRARVGFSDTLEYIPRPLSLVSSDASSTATARPHGHSVSGSLSSVVSATDESEKMAAQTKDEPRKTTTSPATPQIVDSRPSTAGAILERTQGIQSVNHNGGSPRRRNSNPTLAGIPDATTGIPSNPSPTKTPKRWSLFGLETFSAPQPPPRPRTGSSGSTESLSKRADAPSTAFGHHLDSPVDASDPAPAPPDDQPPRKKKPKKRKKKVKAWAGSILKSKSKSRVLKNDKDSGEAAPVVGEDSTELASPESTQRQIVASPMTPTLTVTDSSGLPQNTQQWKPRSASTPEDDFALAMIDLDAALGPFNTPLPHNAEWDAAQKAAGPNAVPPKRQLHSAQGLRGFSGPGMHYHRRAESAPEMPPFEMGRFGIPRFGSSSTMADVFEEEEEEDDDEEGDEEDEDDEEDDSITNVSSAPSKESSRGAPKQDAPEMGSDEETPPVTTAPTNAILGPPVLENTDADKTRHATSMKSERSINSLQDQIIIEEPGGVDFRAGSVFQPRDDSTGSSTPSPRRALGNGDMAPLDVSPLHLPISSTVPVSPYSTSHASSFPSPRSPMSYDAHRISTAPSSVNEENNFQSLLLGEPGPEVRLSVDMPPSLTSSNSTMTRDSTFIPPAQPRPRKPNRPEERPASVSSTAFGRRRSSLASLSRLISSSHGERSKLSMEVPMDDDGDKKQKSSRTKRLSRMMQFWKSKEENQT